jgi:transglutaminase-like putative cysteine protease
MIYDIRQSTTYRYASSVAYARHVLRLTPIDRAGQRINAAALDIEPAPRLRREGNDFFGNRMTWIELDQPHDTLSVRVAARVAVKRDHGLDAASTPSWEGIRRAASAAVDLSASSPVHSSSPAAKYRLIRKFAPTPPRASPPAGRCWSRRPT